MVKKKVFFWATLVIMVLFINMSLFVFYLLSVKHFSFPLYPALLRNQFVAHFIISPRLRKILDRVEEDNPDHFQTRWDIENEVFLSQALFRTVHMDNQVKYIHHPRLVKISFILEEAGHTFMFEIKDSPEVRDMLKHWAFKKKILRANAVSFDNFGFRKTGFENKKNCPEKILFVGDSFTEGLWVNDFETFASHLGRHLERSTGNTPCVINSGVNGYGPLEYAYITENYFEELRFNTLFVIHFANDISANASRVVSGTLKNSGQKWETNFGYLKRISDLAKNHGIKMVLAAIPPKEQLEQPETRIHYQEKLKAFCEKESILFVDPLDDFVVFGKGKLYFNWDPHFHKGGHRIFAEILWRAAHHLFSDSRKLRI